jgi:hypothetical protein
MLHGVLWVSVVSAVGVELARTLWCDNEGGTRAVDGLGCNFEIRRIGSILR